MNRLHHTQLRSLRLVWILWKVQNKSNSVDRCRVCQ